MTPLTPDELAARSMQVLRRHGVRILPGMSEAELARVQDQFGFRFVAEHRAFLRIGLPAGNSWPDWRAGPELGPLLNRPVDGVLFDVRHNDRWPAGWGARPADPAEREAAARAQLARAPRLVPVHGHRYLPAAPAGEPSPVLSVMQSDVIYYGGDLLNYVEVEFAQAARRLDGLQPVPFWSELAAVS